MRNRPMIFLPPTATAVGLTFTFTFTFTLSLTLMATACLTRPRPQRPAADTPAPRRATGPARAAAPRPGALPYAGLFVRGARWSFAVKQRVSTWDGPSKAGGSPQKRTATQYWTVTCEVSRVGSHRGARVAQVTCPGRRSTSAVPFVGVWLFTREGIYRQEHWPTAAPPAKGRQRPRVWLAARPQVTPPRRRASVGAVVRTVTRQGKLWCVEDFYGGGREGGDEGSRTVCLHPTKGIQSGASSFTGGSEIRTVYSRQP